MSYTTVIHLDRVCEILWQTGHPRIAEALHEEVEAVVAERDRLARVLYPHIVVGTPSENT
jgi:hypothetical protein